MIDIRCPHCGKVHAAPATLVGRKVRCKECQHVFRAATVAQAGGTVPGLGPATISPTPPPPPGPPRVAPPLLRDSQPIPPAEPPISPLRPPMAERLSGVCSRAEPPPEPPRAQVPPDSDVFAPPLPPQHSRRPLVLLCAALLLLAAGAGGYWYFFLDVGLPDWTGPYLADRANLVAYVRCERLRESSLYQDIQAQYITPLAGVRREADPEGKATFGFAFADLSELFLCGSEQGFLAVIRTNRDFQPADLFPRAPATPGSHNGHEYIRIGGADGPATQPAGADPPGAGLAPRFLGTAQTLWSASASGTFLAQTAPRTYCVCTSLPMLRSTLDRLDRGVRAAAGPNLAPLLDQVKGHDHFGAICESPFHPEISAGAFGLTLNEQVKFSLAARYGSADEARKTCDMMQDQQAAIRVSMKVGAPAASQSAAVKTLAENLSFSHDQGLLIVRFSAPAEDVRTLIHQAASIVNPLLPQTEP